VRGPDAAGPLLEHLVDAFRAPHAAQLPLPAAGGRPDSRPCAAACSRPPAAADRRRATLSGGATIASRTLPLSDLRRDAAVPWPPSPGDGPRRPASWRSVCTFVSPAG
jgi:hypothetical protein